MANDVAMAAKTGKIILFIGNECMNWKITDFIKAAQNAKALGCDTIAAKRMNGLYKWYLTPANLAAEKAAVNAVGVGYIPWGYCYGPVFGGSQIASECAILQEMMEATDGIAAADMEAEWNGKVTSANQFAAWWRLHKKPGQILIVSTWADPTWQNWSEVVKALVPCVDIWGPQQYTNFLIGMESTLGALGETCIQPEFDMLADFGANNVVAATKQAIAKGHQAFWIWEYQSALKYPNIVAQFALVQVKAQPAPTAPIALPNPPAAPVQSIYLITTGDTLSKIARKLKLVNWFDQLYRPNAAAIEEAAHLHGEANSQLGKLIYPGTALIYTP
jgi:hypothetical protein